MIKLMLYKTDNYRSGCKGENSSYNISVVAFSEREDMKSIEMLINEA